MSDLVSQTSKVIKEVIKTMNRSVIGLFFLRKIPKRKNLNPPTLSFSCQFFKNIFLGNFVQIFVRFDFRLHLILNPRGYDFQLKFLKIFSSEISLRFCHDFTDRSYSVRNTSSLSIRRGCIRYNPYMPQLTR